MSKQATQPQLRQPLGAALQRFDRAYREALPALRRREHAPEAMAALRDAAKAVRDTPAPSDNDLAGKVRVAALIGIYTRRGRPSERPYDQDQADLGHLQRLPDWAVGGAVVRRLLPRWIQALGDLTNRDQRLVLRALEDAGPSWRASVAADLQRLSGTAGATA